jgi:hypothetical protein
MSRQHYRTNSAFSATQNVVHNFPLRDTNRLRIRRAEPSSGMSITVYLVAFDSLGTLRSCLSCG